MSPDISPRVHRTLGLMCNHKTSLCPLKPLAPKEKQLSMDARKEGLPLETLFSDQVRTCKVGMGRSGNMGSTGACDSLCLVSWWGCPVLPGGWVLRYRGFVLAGDRNEKVLKVAKDPSPESPTWTCLGPGMRVVWGMAVKIGSHWVS